MADTGIDGVRWKPAEAGIGRLPLRVFVPRGQSGGFARAAALGFSHVLLPPPWLSAPGRPYLTEKFEPAGLSLDQLAARADGVGVLIDVTLDRVSAKAAGGMTDAPFTIAGAGAALDPRAVILPGVAVARSSSTEDVAALAAWWGPRLAKWYAEGVAGFRLVGLDAIPGSLLALLIGSLRDAVPDAILLAWTPGLSRPAQASLRGCGLDGVFCSLPWWDGRAQWLWDEVAELAAVAPVLGLDAVPVGPQPAQGVRVPAGLAACVGQGWLHVETEDDDEAALLSLNALVAATPALSARVTPRLPLGDGGAVLALLRADAAEYRMAGGAALSVVNLDPVAELVVRGADVLAGVAGAFQPFRDAAGVVFGPASAICVAPGAAVVFTALARPAAVQAVRSDPEAARAAGGRPRLAIEAVLPCVDEGLFAVKAVAGETVPVRADVVFDGHEKIAVALRWRGPGEAGWQEAPMRPLGNDRWAAEMPLAALGRHEYVVHAWRDRFETFRDELAKKAQAGLVLTLELAEGDAMVRDAAARAEGGAVRPMLATLAGGDQAARVRAFLSPALAAAMAAADDRPFRVESAAVPVDAERALARFASWYEVFPRSLSDDPYRHGTFADVERHLPRIRDMGFDVLYFPPISPIGRTNRKGRNNTLTPAADDPGSPYAVGSADGGHDALHPELGTLEDFAHLQRAAASHGLEIAIDFAIQCSPDHPWLKQHRGWFDWRPDGSIKYAENPPKKYEDIVNVDFYAKDAIPGLWAALCDVVLFWCEQGIRIFRVDNPHTKPFPFWEWMIREVRARYPDAMFLAEAFTRPKVMYRLAKIGFSQSYTYFTWRNEKAEITEYLTELNQAPVSYFFRPHFFVNTPDINPVFLQGSGRPGFLIRAALAATLSGLFGVYNGFELCEAMAVPGKEEYLDSEKYQLRAWDWDRPGNIVAELTALNRIRRRNAALQTHLGVHFLGCTNGQVLFFEKATLDRSNVVLVAISLDPHATQEAEVALPLWSWHIPAEGSLQMQDLLTDQVSTWHGERHLIRLTPEHPYILWRASPAI